METYAAQVASGVVRQVIVGDATWAAAALGGTWVDTDTLVGIGWTWDGETFTAPVYPDDEGADAASTV